jgi:peptidoglycan/LPS O-acetylase OafA/YrhL
MSSTKDRVKLYDRLRGLAILTIILWHYVHNPSFGNGAAIDYVRQILSFTWNGVDLFFVFSGFLIGGNLISSRGSDNYFKSFYIRRVLRIFPMYYITLFLYYAILVLLPNYREQHFDWLLEPNIPLWSYAVFVQNFFMATRNSFGPNWLGITWSLAVEEQFYLLVPLVVYVLRPRQLVWFSFACIVAAPLLRILLVQGLGMAPIASYVLMPCRMDSLFLGVLMAQLARLQPGFFNDPVYRRWAWAVAVGLGSAILVRILLPGGYDVFDGLITSIGYSADSLFFAAMIFLLNGRRSDAPAGLAGRVFERAGLWCFTIYLFHQPVHGLLFHLIGDDMPHVTDWSGVLMTLASLAATFAIAWAAWTLIEAPLLALGHRLVYSRRLPPPDRQSAAEPAGEAS